MTNVTLDVVQKIVTINLTGYAASSFGALADVDVTGVLDGQIVRYNETTGNREASDDQHGTTTASNGLTKTLSNIKLGGALIDTTTLIDVGSKEMYIASNNSEFYIADNRVRASTSSYKAFMDLYSTYSSLGRDRAGGGYNQIYINETKFEIEVGAGIGGATYKADYSANFVDRSLVDKAFVVGKTDANATNIATNAAAIIEVDDNAFFYALAFG